MAHVRTRFEIGFYFAAALAALGWGASLLVEPVVSLTGTDAAGVVQGQWSRSSKGHTGYYLRVAADSNTDAVRVTPAAYRRLSPGAPVKVRVGPFGWMAATWGDLDAPVTAIAAILGVAAFVAVLGIRGLRRRRAAAAG